MQLLLTALPRSLAAERGGPDGAQVEGALAAPRAYIEMIVKDVSERMAIRVDAPRALDASDAFSLRRIDGVRLQLRIDEARHAPTVRLRNATAHAPNRTRRIEVRSHTSFIHLFGYGSRIESHSDMIG